MNIREVLWLVLPQSLWRCLAQLSSWLAAAVTALGHSQDEPRQLVDLFSTSSPARLQRSDSCPRDSLTRCWFWQKSQFQVFLSLPFLYIYSCHALPSDCFLPSAAPCLWACFINWITKLTRSKTVPSPSRELFLRDKVRLPLQLPSDLTLTFELLHNAKLKRPSPQQSKAELFSGSQTHLWKLLASSLLHAILKV